jgi:hypothetical protein
VNTALAYNIEWKSVWVKVDGVEGQEGRYTAEKGIKEKNRRA